MSHQPFESWLLSEEPLAPDQIKALQAHLETCDACRQLSFDWAAVKKLFVSIPALKPAPGFSARWQARLALDSSKEKRRIHLRQSLLFFLINAVSALTLFLLIALQLLQSFDTPVEVLLVGVDRLTTVLQFFKAIQEILAAVILVLTSIISPEGWVILATASGLICLAWIASLRRLIIARRILS
jgi:hypothetical protein